MASNARDIKHWTLLERKLIDVVFFFVTVRTSNLVESNLYIKKHIIDLCIFGLLKI